MFLICSYFPDWTLQCHKEECQTEYNKNTLFLFFHSFTFKQCTEASTGKCSKKSRFCNCAKTNQRIPAKEFNLSLKLQLATLLKFNSFTGIFHRCCTQMQLYTLQISYFEEHLFKYFCRTSSMAPSQYHFSTINKKCSRF